MKITHRWSGDKTHKILSIHNHKDLSSNRSAWLDFMPLICRVYEQQLAVKITLDHELHVLYGEWIKDYRSPENLYDYLILQSVHKYILTQQMKPEKIYELLVRVYEILL